MSIFDIVGRLSRTNQKIVLSQAAFSGCALLVLIMVYAVQGGVNALLGIGYGVCLLACSVASYLYTIRYSRLATRTLKQLDHAAIFLLVAGTFTPFAALDNVTILGVAPVYWVWGFALAGLTLRLIISDSYNKVFVALYVVLGWFFILAIAGASRQIPLTSLILLGVGALAYSFGAIIFARGIGPRTDAVWHGSVFAAALFHFMAILNFVLQPA